MKLNKLLLPVFAIASLVFVGCEDDVASKNDLNSDHVTFMKQLAPIEIEAGASAVVEGKVYASQTKNTDRVIELEVVYTSTHNDAMETSTVPITTVDEADFSVPATVTIPAGEKTGTFEINITNVN